MHKTKIKTSTKVDRPVGGGEAVFKSDLVMTPAVPKALEIRNIYLPILCQK